MLEDSFALNVSSIQYTIHNAQKKKSSIEFGYAGDGKVLPELLLMEDTKTAAVLSVRLRVFNETYHLQKEVMGLLRGKVFS